MALRAGMDVLERAPLKPVRGEALPYDGYTVTPLSLQVFPEFRISGAIWEPENKGEHPAVLLAHGHFGQGKSSGEVQAPAHALAANGYVVLALDTPGVEEGDTPGRQIHFDGGAHNRALLAAADTSAMAVQLHGLQAGLDYLDERGDSGKIGVTGASGGSVQALYLSFIDPRVDAVALASFVPMPREARAGGCACDALPGWPGPDPALYAATPVPSLWLSEVQQDRPAGLPRSAEFLVLEGPHGYEAPMVAAMLDFFGDELGGSSKMPEPVHTPSNLLVSQDVGSAGLRDLVQPRYWPYEKRGYMHELTCSGHGPLVYTAGDVLPLEGHKTCAVTLALTHVDLDEALIRQEPSIDRVGAALSSLDGPLHADRAWGLAAERAGLQVGQDLTWTNPITCADITPQDPPWAWAGCRLRATPERPPEAPVEPG
ncbi:MAG: hypothetical protein GY913_11430 [Proteobacteria bacterium]|nr:hypothetical protein [Pseudomonadota bacterium]MCP4917526.1 hypothetical protein [Pseudomonadota bacterium]